MFAVIDSRSTDEQTVLSACSTHSPFPPEGTESRLRRWRGCREWAGWSQWARLLAPGCETRTSVSWPCRWADSQSPGERREQNWEKWKAGNATKNIWALCFCNLLETPNSLYVHIYVTALLQLSHYKLKKKKKSLLGKGVEPSQLYPTSEYFAFIYITD